MTADKTDIFNEKKVANGFNNFSTNSGTDLANIISDASKSFDSYVTKSQPLPITGPERRLFQLKPTRA